ncbi:MAG: arginine--tRNA ligase [Methanobrevibacter sp.]|nr:arginine--tRNA ligase [Methanobrevibacter sp.]
MYFKIKKEAEEALRNAVEGFDCEFDEEIKLEFPPNPELGDLASTISFQLAKILRKAPNLIALELVEKIELPEIFEKVEATGPYVNFFINHDIFAKQLLDSVEEDYGQLGTVDEKIILEHTSANPNGPLHIGHIRNAVIGDSLRRLLTKAGYNVDTQYYVNDMGRQLAMIVYGMEELGLKLEDQPAEKIDHKVGELYFKVNQMLKEDESLSEGVDATIRKYEGGPSELDEKFEYAVNSCLEGVKETLKRMNVKHDAFVWEGQFVRTGIVDNLTQELIDIGYARQGEVLYLDLSEFNIPKELVLRRADGTSLYSTRDIAYHIYKSKNCDKIIDIFGSDHKLAARQVELALEILEEIEPNSDKIEVIFYEFITLPEGSMSTRRGVFISVDELMDEAVKRAKEEIKSRRPDLDEATVDEIAEEIGIGAIRYYIARLSPEKHITFKWDEALSFERGCASIQYAHARACKLLKKAKEENGIDLDTISVEENWSLGENERELVKLIAKFPSLIEDSAKIRRVHPIAQYCQDLAGAFNRFYKSEQVIGSDVENARLILVEKSRITLKNALDILGVSAPDMM